MNTDSELVTKLREPPKNMHAEAKKIWNDVLPCLHREQGIQATDYMLFEDYCNVSASLRLLAPKVVGCEITVRTDRGPRAKLGDTVRSKSIELDTYAELLRIKRLLARDLGIGIVTRKKNKMMESRQRQLDKKKDTETTTVNGKNPLLEFVRGNNNGHTNGDSKHGS